MCLHVNVCGVLACDCSWKRVGAGGGYHVFWWTTLPHSRRHVLTSVESAGSQQAPGLFGVHPSQCWGYRHVPRLAHTGAGHSSACPHTHAASTLFNWVMPSVPRITGFLHYSLPPKLTTIQTAKIRFNSDVQYKASNRSSLFVYK